MSEAVPTVLITGVRWTGKTSLLRQLYLNASCLTLDLPANGEAVSTVPDKMLAASHLLDRLVRTSLYGGLSI